MADITNEFGVETTVETLPVEHAGQEMTLLDLCNQFDNVFIWVSEHGNPFGYHIPAGYPDLSDEFLARRGNLAGEIDTDGDWVWAGDWDICRSGILNVTATQSPDQWAKLVKDYENMDS